MENTQNDATLGDQNLDALKRIYEERSSTADEHLVEAVMSYLMHVLRITARAKSATDTLSGMTTIEALVEASPLSIPVAMEEFGVEIIKFYLGLIFEKLIAILDSPNDGLAAQGGGIDLNCSTPVRVVMLE